MSPLHTYIAAVPADPPPSYDIEEQEFWGSSIRTTSTLCHQCALCWGTSSILTATSSVCGKLYGGGGVEKWPGEAEPSPTEKWRGSSPSSPHSQPPL